LWHEQAALTMPELNKAILAAPDHQKLSAFEKRFTDAYGRTPSPIASLAYDGVALTAALLQQYPSDPFRLDRISNPNGFSGVGGVFRFLTNGVSQRQLNIVQIRDGAFHVLQPAKENFVQ
jgi:branched-chain amino acid transport system substrate-binding protein